jgi:hypothetical protein
MGVGVLSGGGSAARTGGALAGRVRGAFGGGAAVIGLERSGAAVIGFRQRA